MPLWLSTSGSYLFLSVLLIFVWSHVKFIYNSSRGLKQGKSLVHHHHVSIRTSRRIRPNGVRPGYLILISIGFYNFNSLFSPQRKFWFRRYIKHLRHCLTKFPNTSKFIKNTLLLAIFSTLFSVFWNVVQHSLSCLMYYFSSVEGNGCMAEACCLNSLKHKINVLNICE